MKNTKTRGNMKSKQADKFDWINPKFKLNDRIERRVEYFESEGKETERGAQLVMFPRRTLRWIQAFDRSIPTFPNQSLLSLASSGFI